MRARFLAMVASILTVVACIATSMDANADQETDAIKQRALRALDAPGIKTAFPCHDAWLASSVGYVLDLEPWAEAYGLKRGDRLVSFGDVSVAENETWGRALERSKKGPFLTIVVDRPPNRLSLQLPCRDNGPLWTIQRQIFEAMAAGNWAECRKRANDGAWITGRRYSVFLRAAQECLAEQFKASGRPLADRYPNRVLRKWGWKEPHPYWLATYLLYTHTLSELRHEPGGVTGARSRILSVTLSLKNAGMEAYADDLLQQLRAATEHAP